VNKDIDIKAEYRPCTLYIKPGFAGE